MRYATFLTSALFAGTLARPHDDLEKRKIVYLTRTEVEVVNVFVTVTDRAVQASPTPKTTPMFSFPDPRTRSRPVFWWPPPKSRSGTPFVFPPPRSSIPSSKPVSTPMSTPKQSSLSSAMSTSSTKPAASSTPKMSSSPKSSSTPAASSTRASSTTPKASSTPPASSAPKVSSPSMVASTLKVSSTPKASSTPKLSSASSSSPKASVAATPSPSQPGTIGPKHISGSSQAELTPDSSNYQNAILYHHNARRANHGSSEMTWCSDCAANAKVAAERCNFTHYIPTGVKNGQNLFITNGDYFNVTAAITESWYKSELPYMNGHYGEKTLDDTTFAMVGHFTQIVWKGTTSVGCYSLDCGNNMVVRNDPHSTLNKYTVCNYSPPGNVKTQFDTNVVPPEQTTNLGSWTD